MKQMRTGLAGAALLLPTLFGGAAWALPEDRGIALVPAASKVAEEIHFFHNWILMPIITVICLFVLALLLWIIMRFNAKANPKPQQFSHNTLLEVIWTGIPILILVFIALFSFDLLYKEDVIPDGKRIIADGDGVTTEFAIKNDFPETRRLARPEHVMVAVASPAGERRLRRGADYTLAGLGESDVTVTLKQPLAAGEQIVITAGRSIVGSNGLFGGDENAEIALAPSVTLKVIGNQWNWTYAYPDFGDFDFVSNMMPKDKTTPALYRFEVDNRVVVPVGETIRVTTTGSDVIHSWALPNFGIKIDAVPGRINETWFKADREGVYYGQCSEICGVKHSAMPIGVEVVSREAFCNWIRTRQAEYAIERTDEQRRAEPVCGALVPPGVAAAEIAPQTFAAASEPQSATAQTVASDNPQLN